MKQYDYIPIGAWVRFRSDKCGMLVLDHTDKDDRWFRGNHRTAYVRPNPVMEGRVTNSMDLVNRTRPVSYTVEVEMLRGPNGSLWSEVHITSEEIIEVVKYP